MALASLEFNVHQFSPSILKWPERDCKLWKRIFMKHPSQRTEQDLMTLDATIGVHVGFLRKLPALIRRQLLRECSLVQLPKGAVLFDQGDEGSDIYIVLSGMVNINVTVERTTRIDDLEKIRAIVNSSTFAAPSGQHTVNTLGPMQSFGELALNSEHRERQATVVAAEDTLLVSVDADAYLNCEASYQESCVGQAIDAMQASPVFAQCPRVALAKLAAAGRLLHFGANEVVIAQGGRPDALCVVCSGECQVNRLLPVPRSLHSGVNGIKMALHGGNQTEISPNVVVVCVLQKGGLLGLTEVLTQRVEYRCSLTATTPASVFLVPKGDVLDLFRADDAASAAALAFDEMSFPNDASLLQRLSRGYNWDLFKVGLVQSMSSKLTCSMSAALISKDALDFRFAPVFDEEALELNGPPGRMPSPVMSDSFASLSTPTGGNRSGMHSSYSRRQRAGLDSRGSVPSAVFAPHSSHKELRPYRGKAAPLTDAHNLHSRGVNKTLARLQTASAEDAPGALTAAAAIKAAATTLEAWVSDEDPNMKALDAFKLPSVWAPAYLDRLEDCPGRTPGTPAPRPAPIVRTSAGQSSAARSSSPTAAATADSRKSALKSGSVGKKPPLDPKSHVPVILRHIGRSKTATSAAFSSLLRGDLDLSSFTPSPLPMSPLPEKSSLLRTLTAERLPTPRLEGFVQAVLDGNEASVREDLDVMSARMLSTAIQVTKSSVLQRTVAHDRIAAALQKRLDVMSGVVSSAVTTEADKEADAPKKQKASEKGKNKSKAASSSRRK